MKPIDIDYRTDRNGRAYVMFGRVIGRLDRLGPLTNIVAIRPLFSVRIPKRLQSWLCRSKRGIDIT